MNPQEIKTNAIKFLGQMLTQPEVLSELQACPEPKPGAGKDPVALGAIMAKHLQVAPPTTPEVNQMAKHIRDATAHVKSALSEHAPAQATQFSPSHFIDYNPSA